MQPDINLVAVVLAGVASMAVGLLWYSNALFGKAWSKLQGWTEENEQAAKKSASKMYSLSFVLALITSYVLAHVMAFSDYYYHYPPIQNGLMSAFCMWIGFVMPVQLTGEMFGAKKWKLFAINTSYQLAWLLAAGLILGLIM